MFIRILQNHKAIHWRKLNSMNFFQFLKSILFFFCAVLLISSCSNVRYTYYYKHKVPYTAPAEPKFAKAIPAKPFLTQTETALKQSQPEAGKKMSSNSTYAKPNYKAELNKQAEQKKVSNDFDIGKYFQEHHPVIIAKDNITIDNRTLMIVLLVVLILILLSLIPGALWLLWVALLVLLILVLVKYLGLFG